MRICTSDLLAFGRGLGLGLPLLVLPVLVGPAQAHGLFDTTNVLADDGNACLGERDCRRVAAKPVRIRAGATERITLRCPADWPYLQGWGARRHEHIGLELFSRRADGLTVAAVNHADSAGRATLIAGCSKQRHHPTAVLESIHPVPSKALKARGL